MANDTSSEPRTKIPTDDRNGEVIRAISTSEERSEYFRRLDKWLHEAYVWQSVAAMLPYHLLAGQSFPDINGFQTATETSGTPLQNDAMDEQNIEPEIQPRHQQDAAAPPLGHEGHEYRIPSIWKRYAAEFIDSVMLFPLKLVITYFTVDLYAPLLDPQLDLLQLDYKMAVDFGSRALLVEMMFRLVVCIYEAFWLRNGMNGTIGGASLGKFCLGLIVVQCTDIVPLNRPGTNDMVIVVPGTDLGLSLAVGRSLVKNFIIALLFPLCCGFFSFRYNRTAYDLICNSLVVEDPNGHPIIRFRRG